MLDGLANAHPAFGRWNKQANTRAAANTLAWIMPPDIEELTQVFEKGRQYKDVPRISLARDEGIGIGLEWPRSSLWSVVQRSTGAFYR
jgi:hypothetical protein